MLAGDLPDGHRAEVNLVCWVLKEWGITVDARVPVPPSNTGRRSQPVLDLARAISERTGMALGDGCRRQVRTIGQLKDIFEFDKRAALLNGAYAAERSLTERKRLLLFDDLFRSGATAEAVAQTLMNGGGAAAVFLLALTRTRSKL
jgi:predicted amidophosphoribosyltransferase